MKKLDCRFTDAGDGGMFDIVSIVRSDSEGRVCRTRPRASCPSSSPTELTSSGVSVSSEPWMGSVDARGISSRGFAGDKYREEGFFSSDSYEGRLKRLWSRPESA